MPPSDEELPVSDSSPLLGGGRPAVACPDAVTSGGGGSLLGGGGSSSGGDASMSGGESRPLVDEAPIRDEPRAVQAGRRPSPREQRVSPAEGATSPRGEGQGSREGPASPREGDARSPEGDASHPSNRAPLAQVIPLHPVSSAAILAMLGRPRTIRAVHSLVAARVPPSCVEDLAQDAFVEAIRAADRSPPMRESDLPAWLGTITRRVVADFLARRARRAKYEGDMPGEPEGEPGAPDGAAGVEASGDDEPPGSPEPSHDPRAAWGDDGEADAWLVRQWLEKQVAGDPRDAETLAILLEHARGGKTYQDIARARGMSLTALSSRIFEFKGRYAPRYRRWRNRAVLLLLLGAVAIGLLLWLWLAPRGAGIRPDLEPPTPVAPSATVVAPGPFEQALPPRTAPGPEKPRRR